MYLYLFWAVVGIVAGLFCAILDEGRRMSSDRRLMIQLCSLIVGYVLTAVFYKPEPDGLNWLLGLVIQVACSELVFRVARPYLAILDPERKGSAGKKSVKADATGKGLLANCLSIQLFCSELLTRLLGR